ncbi:MAG: flagellar hook basal-body protein [Alicyclobacillaceae bacterium]|nr:flagellar hook basal-body protein [Alicyclobacillaceae bacterium]
MQSLWTSLSALGASLNALDQVSANIANQDTPGYAEENGSFLDTYTQVLQAQATAPGAAPRYTLPGWWGGTGALAGAAEPRFEGMGTISTGVPTDMAVEGPGFFMVRGSDGRTWLTRSGDFQWSLWPGGNVALTTPAGLPVLDTAGRPVVLRQAPADWSVGADGQLTVNGRPGPRLAVAEVAEPDQNLEPAGDGAVTAYVPKPGAVVTVVNRAGAAPASRIVQGALNMSNVDMAAQMTELIEAQRLFELNAEALQVTDRMMETANGIRT